MGTLTVARAKSLAEPGLYRAGPTLYLRIAPGGSKSWIQRLTIEGRRHDLGLGGFPLVTLAEARALAYETGDSRALAAIRSPRSAEPRPQPSSRPHPVRATLSGRAGGTASTPPTGWQPSSATPIQCSAT